MVINSLDLSGNRSYYYQIKLEELKLNVILRQAFANGLFFRSFPFSSDTIQEGNVLKQRG
jgi:hypothetical protein